MAISVKLGVQPALISLVVAVANVAERLGETTYISAGIDGVHLLDSFHYKLCAIDVSSRPLKDKYKFVAELIKELGAGYDIFLEQAGLPNEHIHLERDPR